MARTSQRAIPLILVGLAVALLAVRIGVTLAKRSAPAGDMIRWTTPEEGLRLAAETGKPVLLDFTAEWCAPCHILDAEVFRNPAIARLVNERYVAIRVVDRQQEEGRNRPAVEALQRRYGVRGFPTVVFADARGGERGRMEGFRGREEFERVMERAR